MSYFDPDVATDAVAFLVKLAGGRLNKVAVAKLLYFADRQAAIETGHSITHAAFFSLPRGPVGREVLDLINRRTQHDRWTKHLRTVDNNVELTRKPSFRNLSRLDVKMLRGQWTKHRHTFNPVRYPGMLVAFSRTLPEWQRPLGREGNMIARRQLLELHGWSERNIAIVEEESEFFAWSREQCA